jgi:hypothetical protein
MQKCCSNVVIVVVVMADALLCALAAEEGFIVQRILKLTVKNI